MGCFKEENPCCPNTHPSGINKKLQIWLLTHTNTIPLLEKTCQVSDEAEAAQQTPPFIWDRDVSNTFCFHVLSKSEPTSKRDFGVIKLQTFIPQKWMRITRVGREADLGKPLSLCLSDKYYQPENTFSTSDFFFYTLSKLAWPCINNLIEMSTLNMMNE